VLALADGRVFERDFVPLDADGVYRGHYWQYRDVTARVRSEAALVAARDAAEAASRVKSDFLARMSHEIRTPMASVLGYADLLLHTDCPPDEAVEHARRIRRNAEHLLGLLDDILDVSRIEAGQLTFSSERLEPARILAAVDSLLRPLAVERGIALRIDARALPRNITSDGLRVQQILVNLVSNAIKFTQRGAVTLRTCVETASEGAWLRIDVEDTGIGIASDKQSKLFEPFSQVHARDVARGRGVGLGLAICARLTAGLRGRLDLRSELGEGSTFTLRLPLSESESRDLEGDAVRDTSRASPPAERYAPVAARRVLVVDDNPDLQLLFGRLLGHLGLAVTFAADGVEGLARVADAQRDEVPFDIILMDMQMPVMDGYEASRELRRRGVTTSIVALTAYAMAGDAERCLDAGCDAYLPKPVDFTKLRVLLAAPPRRVPADAPQG
jgi:signal transduction histidine kinase/CheY-like chemotaxis protein